MKGIAARFGWFGAGLFCLITVGWVLASPQGKPLLKGLPMDWTHRHVIFSQPATAEQARLLANEPRFWQQEYRRQALRVVSNGMAATEEANSLALAFKGVSTANVHRDWSQDIGSGASTGAGIDPAKYGFQVTVANCVSSGHPDFVVFGTGVSGGPTQASIVAYDNLYSGCTGTVPQVSWAYNLNGGFIPTSPVFSQEGTQLAFTGTDGITAKLVLLTWQSSTTETVSNPLLVLPTANNAYVGCTAPCMTTIQLIDGNGVNTLDTTSSVFYDYGPDTAWVGDSGGWLHKFHPVFNGTPAEIRAGGWPVQVNPGSPKALSNPVHDRVSHQVFVGDLGGFLARVNDSTGAVTLSGRLDSGPGLVAGPIVDPTAAKLYVFAASDGTTSCGAGTQPCTAVYLLPTNFAAGATTPKTAVGTSSATPNPMYDGGFDSAYLSSANATGNLYVCGNTGGVPGLYRIPITAGVAGAVVAGPSLASATTRCSPVTDIPNPNVTGGDTLALARQGGFLMHSASAIRNGKAFLFAGISGAGKTTISRLAPSDATLLTDEISYVRKQGAGYVAFGTPFTGELAKLGENVSAPVAALYLLAQGSENRIDPVPDGEAARSLLANVLFFAEDEELVQSAFHAAFDFVSRVPVSRLTFVPDARVWELIR